MRIGKSCVQWTCPATKWRARGARPAADETEMPFADALKRCLELALAVRHADLAKAAGVRSRPVWAANWRYRLQQPVTRHLYSFRHVRRLGRIKAPVLLAKAEVEDKSDEQPHDEPHPIRPAKPVNHRAAGNDAEYRDEGRGWQDKYALQLGVGQPHDPHARAS